MFSARNVHAVVLTGGRSSRMGGRHKPGIEIAGRSIINRTVSTLWSVAPHAQVIIAGSDAGLSTDFRQRCSVVREDPPFSGPLAGVAAALEELPAEAEIVVLLGGDLPFLAASTMTRLIEAVDAGADAASCRDATGHLQYLVSGWDAAVLADQVHRVGDPEGVPLRALFDGVAPQLFACDPDELRDIDTPTDLARAVATADGRPVPEALLTALDAFNAEHDGSSVLTHAETAELLEFTRAVKHSAAPVSPVIAAFLAGQVAGSRPDGSVADALRAVLELVEVGEQPGDAHPGSDDTAG